MIRPLPINGLPAATRSKVTHPTAFAAQGHLVGGGNAKGESQGGNEEKDTAWTPIKRRANLPVGFHTRSEKEKDKNLT